MRKQSTFSPAFQEYTSSAAFRLELSPRMIEVLLFAAIGGEPPGNLNLGPYRALERRGLLEWRIVNGKKEGPRITEAGRLVAQLLEIAGHGEAEKERAA